MKLSIINETSEAMRDLLKESLLALGSKIEAYNPKYRTKIRKDGWWIYPIVLEVHAEGPSLYLNPEEYKAFGNNWPEGSTLNGHKMVMAGMVVPERWPKMSFMRRMPHGYDFRSYDKACSFNMDGDLDELFKEIGKASDAIIRYDRVRYRHH